MPLLVLLLVSSGTFLLAHAALGSPVDTILSERSADNPKIRAAAEKRYGFDKPVPEQYVTYVRNLFRVNLGDSVSTRRPVMTDLRQFVPGTIELTLAARTFAICFGIPLGIIAAVKRDRWPDHGARVLALTGASAPAFWLSLNLLFNFFYHLQWMPVPGRLDIGTEPPPRMTGLIAVYSLLHEGWSVFWSSIKHMILPAIALGAGLSFIGLGAVPPKPEWGATIKQGTDNGLEHWWYAAAPGLAIVSVEMGLSFFGDGLRDALDPKRRG